MKTSIDWHAEAKKLAEGWATQNPVIPQDEKQAMLERFRILSQSFGSDHTHAVDFGPALGLFMLLLGQESIDQIKVLLNGAAVYVNTKNSDHWTDRDRQTRLFDHQLPELFSNLREIRDAIYTLASAVKDLK